MIEPAFYRALVEPPLLPELLGGDGSLAGELVDRRFGEAEILGKFR